MRILVATVSPCTVIIDLKIQLFLATLAQLQYTVVSLIFLVDVTQYMLQVIQVS